MALKVQTHIRYATHSFVKEHADNVLAYYLDSNFKILHRFDGPALIRPNGELKWYQNGLLHRVDGPAWIYPDGKQEWYYKDKLHRIDGPAVISQKGRKEWHINGKLHRIGKPAVVSLIYKKWYVDGELHRMDGPAIERSFSLLEYNNKDEWYFNGIKHKNVKYIDGVVANYNDNGELHSIQKPFVVVEGDEDFQENYGPAIIYPDGRQYWYIDGLLHREDGPAIIYPDGGKEWYISGKLHREDGPAIEQASTKKWTINAELHHDSIDNNCPTGWYFNGILHENVKYVDDEVKVYNTNGKLHCEHGPAIIYSDGTREWYIDGKLHREDGPAIINSKYKEWYINGERHREDGPAIECSNGTKKWYINGKLQRTNDPTTEDNNLSVSLDEKSP